VVSWEEDSIMSSLRNSRTSKWIHDPRCRYCGKITILPEDTSSGGSGKVPDNMATIDHLYPRTKTTERDNSCNRWILCCRECNHVKSKIEDPNTSYQKKLELARHWEMVEIDSTGDINIQSIYQ
jgi:5-methylcytosine-specific restriction endonuclease McrA